VTTVRGVKIAVIAASQVQDETLANFTAGPAKAGIASAFSPQLIAAVKAAKAAGDVVITYIHWGTEYTSCPNANQKSLATQLAAAGASAVIGTHAHMLQGAGWRPDGTYVAYGLGNYLWWESFGNNQDDNGVLTLTFDGDKVVSDSFAPSHLDSTGVPVPATGATLAHINAEWTAARACSGLAASPS
jgi:2',3'-cyclic-nucleotide 2'-phosphodiesterase (5'-nucleotidase family)